MVSTEKKALTEKQINRISGALKRGLIALGGVGTMLSSAMINAQAFGGNVTVSTADLDPQALGGKIISLMIWVFRIIGIGVAGFGIYELVMSFVQQQPEAKTKGITLLLVGLLLVSITFILRFFGLIA